MNNKDKSIIEVVHHLQAKFGKSEVILKDFWDGDNCAIGLTDKTEQYLIYISTFGKKKNEFYVALENPPIDDNFPYTPAGDFENVNLSGLEELLSSHFKIR